MPLWHFQMRFLFNSLLYNLRGYLVFSWKLLRVSSLCGQYIAIIKTP